MSVLKKKQNIRVHQLRDLLASAISGNSHVRSAVLNEMHNVRLYTAKELEKLGALVEANLSSVSPEAIEEMNRSYPRNCYAQKLGELQGEALSLGRAQREIFYFAHISSVGEMSQAVKKYEEEVLAACKAEDKVNDKRSAAIRLFNENYPEIAAFNNKYPDRPITLESMKDEYISDSALLAGVLRLAQIFTLGQSEKAKRFFAAKKALGQVKDKSNLARDFKKKEAVERAYLEAVRSRAEKIKYLHEIRNQEIKLKNVQKAIAQNKADQSGPAVKSLIPQALASYMTSPAAMGKVIVNWPAKAQAQAKESVIRLRAYDQLKNVLAAEGENASKLERNLSVSYEKAKKAVRRGVKKMVSTPVAQLKMIGSSQMVRGSYLRANSDRFRKGVSAFRLDANEAKAANARYASFDHGNSGGAFTFLDYMLWSYLMKVSPCDKSFVNQTLSVDANTFPVGLAAPSQLNVAPDLSKFITFDYICALGDAGLIDLSSLAASSTFEGAASEVVIPNLDGIDFSNSAQLNVAPDLSKFITSDYIGALGGAGMIDPSSLAASTTFESAASEVVIPNLDGIDFSNIAQSIDPDLLSGVTSNLGDTLSSSMTFEVPSINIDIDAGGGGSFDGGGCDF